ncbi:peroxisomal biogenesis factor 1 isoform X2 [Leptinotarsa decemlineata]|uniref:peroxisomal biogenesis factor 1 isoform X2 n=1 Tax=Leptinotarsa decemlineata TaxID=7539 RepID=UPI003D30B155
MFERTLFVKYVPGKNNFVYVPPSLKFLQIGTCLRLSYDENKEAYCSVGATSIEMDENSIGLNSLFAKTLGIKENGLLVLSEIAQLPSVNSITISPVSQNDYDVIDILSDNIQGTLLNQIRVVFYSQSFIIWIGNNIHVTVYVEEVKPVSPGVIDFLTEVHIKPTGHIEKNKSLDIPKSEKPNNFLLEERLTKFYNSFFKKEGNEVANLQRYFNKKYDLICRLVPLTEIPFGEQISKYLQPFNIFISKKCIWLKESTLSTPTICSLTLLKNDVFANEMVFARLIAFEDILDKFEFNLGQNLFVGPEVSQIFDCELGARVILKYIENVPFVSEIIVNSRKNYLVNVEETIKEYLAKNSDAPTVLNANVVIDIGNNISCSLRFSPNEQKFCLVNDDLVRNCKYVIHYEMEVVDSKKKCEEKSFDTFLDNISNMKLIVEDVLRIYENTEDCYENVLITGKPGTGKSALSKYIARKLQLFPLNVYTKTIKCKTFKGKTMESLLKSFYTDFSELLLHQPSVMILDDLEVLCENVAGDNTAPNAVYFNRISEMLHNLFKLFSNSNRIGICATAESTDKLNKNLFSSRGSHLFKNVYTIDEYTKLDRKVVLQKLFADFELDGVDFEELSMKTEGFVIQDIVDFHNKTLFEAYKDELDENSSITITKTHCDKALKNTCVLSLQNVHLHSPGDNDFSHIGGLHDIKKVLVENLLWPAQYPGIFSKAPLRLQSGLLLYGPPGTGKTLLAAAAAKQCGLRLISVKGPELLSKYIGASEQAVRDVFQNILQSTKRETLHFVF